ncbi:hypothetical protein DUI87_17402 [Hirundo rustica rustica]|uniref:Uncharacterized protein n=1 Tax=Hirundo rustica rustica TaxID=333673 RepID=A0A3M0JY77_HIRRU|nr:hypothetical protein DUI87_17402 [Hirundo rustica rustica]
MRIAQFAQRNKVLQGVQNHLPGGRLSPEQWIRAVRDTVSILHCEDTVSILLHRDTVSILHCEDIVSILLHRDTVSILHCEDTVSILLHRDTVSILHCEDTVSILLHRDTVSILLHRDTKSILLHRDTKSILLHRDTVSILLHRDTVSILLCEDTVSILLHRDTVSILLHRDTVSILHCEDTVSILLHRDTVSILHCEDTVSILHCEDTVSILLHRDTVSILHHGDTMSSPLPWPGAAVPVLGAWAMWMVVVVMSCLWPQQLSPGSLVGCHAPCSKPSLCRNIFTSYSGYSRLGDLQKAAEDTKIVSGESPVAFNVWKDTAGTQGCCPTRVCQGCGVPKTSVFQLSRVGVMGQTGQGIDSIVRVLLWDLLAFRVFFTTSPHFCSGY